MTPINFLKRLMLAVLVCAAPVANATAGRGPDHSTLHVGLRLLGGCELRTTPPRANCSRGTPMAIALPARSTSPEATAIATAGQDASALALAGPAPADAARVTTVVF